MPVTSDVDIFRSAKLLTDQHGEEAAAPVSPAATEPGRTRPPGPQSPTIGMSATTAYFNNTGNGRLVSELRVVNYA